MSNRPLEDEGCFESITKPSNSISKNNNIERSEKMSELLGLMAYRVNTLLGVRQIIFSGGKQVGYIKNAGNGLVQYLAKNGEILKIKGKDKFEMMEITLVDSETGTPIAGRITVNGELKEFKLEDGEYQVEEFEIFIPYYKATGVNVDISHNSNLDGKIVHEIDFSVDNIHIVLGYGINEFKNFKVGIVGSIVDDIIKKLRQKKAEELKREQEEELEKQEKLERAKSIFTVVK